MKLTINKLIANDIINYGMDHAKFDEYTLSLEDYLEDFERLSQRYILNSIDEIMKDIELNENIESLNLEETNECESINMKFYHDNLLSQMENMVKEIAKENNINLTIEEIKNISEKVIDSDDFYNEIVKYIKDYSKDRSL